MSVKPEDFPDLAGMIELAGRNWTYTVKGDYEHDTVLVSVSLEAGRTKAGPFEFWDGKIEETDDTDVSFTQDCLDRLGEEVLALIRARWPMDW